MSLKLLVWLVLLAGVSGRICLADERRPWSEIFEAQLPAEAPGPHCYNSQGQFICVLCNGRYELFACAGECAISASGQIVQNNCTEGEQCLFNVTDFGKNIPCTSNWSLCLQCQAIFANTGSSQGFQACVDGLDLTAGYCPPW